jgi:hypothetical protein
VDPSVDGGTGARKDRLVVKLLNMTVDRIIEQHNLTTTAATTSGEVSADTATVPIRSVDFVLDNSSQLRLCLLVRGFGG